MKNLFENVFETIRKIFSKANLEHKENAVSLALMAKLATLDHKVGLR